VMAPILQGSRSVMSGHTYSANPQSAAVSLAVLSYIDKHGLVQAAKVKGALLLDRLRLIADRHAIIGDVRGKGLLTAMEFVGDRTSKRLFPAERGVTNRIIDLAFQKGLLVYPAAGGVDGEGDAIIIAPPLTITDEELELLAVLLEDTIREVVQELAAEHE